MWDFVESLVLSGSDLKQHEVYSKSEKHSKWKTENGMFPLSDNSHLLSIDYKSL